MIPVTTFRHDTVALFGLGRSGIATAHALNAGGADVVAYDDSALRCQKALEAGLVVKDLRNLDWSNIAALVLSPGVPLTHPEPHWSVNLANKQGVEVVGDIELFCRERRILAPNAPFIAITGTNGKSTTTALIAHMLKSAGLDIAVGGNIGTAILSLELPRADLVFVIECSSYQIDLTPSLNPTIGVLLNLSPDHLDRHGTMENYEAIKTRLVGNSDLAILGLDDERTRNIGDELSTSDCRVMRIANHYDKTAWVYTEDRVLKTAGLDQFFFDLDRATALRGMHNSENAAAAVAVCLKMNVGPNSIASGLRSFPGLPHRMEEISTEQNVVYINDSKATNVGSADWALSSFDNIFWIAGGRSKKGGISSLSGRFSSIRKVFLVGESAAEFAETLEGLVQYEICGTLERAVEASRQEALAYEGDATVLLSPACSSFDQFPNFEARGEAFRKLVNGFNQPDAPQEYN